MARPLTMRWHFTPRTPSGSLLRWASTGSPRPWMAPGGTDQDDDPARLLATCTPPPWTYCLGIVEVRGARWRPVVLFKNAVPAFEGRIAPCDGARLPAGAWADLRREAWRRNPGLTGLLDEVEGWLGFAGAGVARQSVRQVNCGS